jgi:hypothetical protein
MTNSRFVMTGSQVRILFAAPVIVLKLLNILRAFLVLLRRPFAKEPPRNHSSPFRLEGADGKYHQAMLSLTSCGIASLTDDLQWLADCLNAR